MTPFSWLPRMIFAMANTPNPIGPAPKTSSDFYVGPHQLASSNRVPPRTHYIKQQRGFSSGDVTRYREKDILVDQLVLPIAAIAVEPHVAALLQTLISKSLPARAAFTTKIH